MFECPERAWVVNETREAEARQTKRGRKETRDREKETERERERKIARRIFLRVRLFVRNFIKKKSLPASSNIAYRGGSLDFRSSHHQDPLIEKDAECDR
jgi:hypothetical protein